MKTSIYKDFKDISSLNQSKLLTGGIIPRPIAWVSTLNDNGTVNLAPFSYFSIVANDVLSIAFTRKQSKEKDTLLNILKNKEAVVNSSSILNLEMVNASEINLPYGSSEVDHLNLSTIASVQIETPSIECAEISYETKLIQHIPLTDDEGKPKSDIVLLQVVGVRINEAIYDEAKNYIDGKALNPASRLAGKAYGSTLEDDSIHRD